MTIDEKPPHIITSTGCSICGTDALHCSFWKSYKQAKKPVMGTAHVDDSGNVTVVPNSPANIALVKKLVECVHFPHPHKPTFCVIKNDKGAEFARLITEANAYLERINHDK